MEETSSTINIPERRGNCAPKNWTPGNGSPFYGRNIIEVFFLHPGNHCSIFGATQGAMIGPNNELYPSVTLPTWATLAMS